VETIFENFRERIEEVNKYYKVLDILEDERVTLVKKSSDRTYKITIDADVNKVLKSTCFLLLYNLIESTVRETFTYLYDTINSENKIIEDYKEEFRTIWLKQHFKNIDPISSNQNTYKEIVSEVINKIIQTENFNMDSSKLPLSGNLDARKIRKLYKEHNIELKVHYRAFGGGELRTIKDHRNELAHGNVSFTECGRQYTLESLQNIKNRTIIYLKSTLRNMDKFIEQKNYAV